jgi:hypothetical protein
LSRLPLRKSGPPGGSGRRRHAGRR